MQFPINRTLLSTLLLFAIAIFVSLDYVILDDEILTLLCFVLFVYFLYHNLRLMIQGELQSRADQIRQQFVEINQIHEQMLITSIEYYRQQISLYQDVAQFHQWTQQEAEMLYHTRKNSLQSLVHHHIANTLQHLALQERNFQQSLREQTTQFFLSQVLAQLPNYQQQILDETISFFESHPISFQE